MGLALKWEIEHNGTSMSKFNGIEFCFFSSSDDRNFMELKWSSLFADNAVVRRVQF